MAYQVATMRAVIAELRAQGITVHEVDGWPTRGSITFDPRGCIIHHTGDGPGDYPTLGMILRGRPDLPPPLAQWGLGRSGDVWAIGAGRANHGGRGGWRGLAGNTSVWGIEAESTGKGDWTDAQRRNYPRLAAALARHTGFGADYVCAHREWAPGRKPDPAGIAMDDFRRQVADLLRGNPPETANEEDNDMYCTTVEPGEELFLAIDGPGMNHPKRVTWLSVISRDGPSKVHVVLGNAKRAQGGMLDLGTARYAAEVQKDDDKCYVGNHGPNQVGVSLVSNPR